MQESPNLQKVKPYPFLKVNKKSKEVEQRDGKPVISLRIGIPDKEAPQAVKQAMVNAILTENSTFGYPCDVHPERGIPQLTDAIIWDYKEKHGVDLKPENIFVTGWTKPMLHNVARLFSDGRILVPDPVYPAYEAAVHLSGHDIKKVPTTAYTNWLPAFNFKKGDVAFYFCDPNNPLGSVADMNYYTALRRDMEANDVGGIFDKAYKDFVFDDETKPISITQVPGLMDRGYEFVSFSKHFNFVGIGLGWVVSSQENIDRLMNSLDANINQGQPWHHQVAGVTALTDPAVRQEMDEYWDELKERRQLLSIGLNQLGLKNELPKATPYVWFKVPRGYNDEQFVLDILIGEAHVAVMPGSYFGKNGRGYARATIYAKKDKIEQGLENIRKVRQTIGTW